MRTTLLKYHVIKTVSQAKQKAAKDIACHVEGLAKNTPMKKITYLKLQEKYPKKIVALDKTEKKVLAVGEKFADIFKKLKAIRINVQNAVFVGPIQKKGAINVYISIPEKNYR